MDNAEKLNEIESKMESVTYAAYETLSARHERSERRLLSIIILLIILLMATNGAWLWHESGYDGYGENRTVTQSNTDGSNNYIGNDGVINNGYTDDSNDKDVP